MNENLIFEGNTIYEIDPDCMRARRNLSGSRAVGVQKMACCQEPKGRFSGNKIILCIIAARKLCRQKR